MPPRAHILMDATTMSYFLSASYPPTEVRAHASRLLPHGRDCTQQWLWPLTERLFPVDGAAHQRCSDRGGSAAGVRVGDGRWCCWDTTTELGEARELLGSHRTAESKGRVGKNQRCRMHSV